MKMILFLFLTLLSFFSQYRAIEAASYTHLIKKGNRFFKNELYKDALMYYLQGRKKNKKASEPIFNAGAAYYKMNDYIKSIESFSEILQKEDPGKKSADIYYNLGNTYYQLGDYQNAVQSYIKGLDIDPDDLNMKYNLELTLKKLNENKQEDRQKQNTDNNKKEDNKEDGSSKKEPADIDTNNLSGKKNDEQKKPYPEDASARNELSREEAERLINSLNTDQTSTIGDIIKQRISKKSDETDW